MIDPQQTVGDLVLDHPECAAVLQRHRIDYCCGGNQTLAGACLKRGLDVGPLAAALEQAVRERGGDEMDARTLSSPALIAHIVVRYHTPLRKTLPFVRTLGAKVARVHGGHNPRLVELDRVIAELADTLEAHIDDEEATLFPTLERREPQPAAAGRLSKTTRDEHEMVGGFVNRMRAASDDYTVPDWACNSYRVLFRELEHLETDVLRHVHLENHVLLPRFAGAAR